MRGGVAGRWARLQGGGGGGRAAGALSTLKKVDCCIHVESSTNSDGKPEAKTWTTPHADIVKYSASTCSRDTTVRSYGRNASPVRARFR